MKKQWQNQAWPSRMEIYSSSRRAPSPRLKGELWIWMMSLLEIWPRSLAAKYRKDPREMELILRESDEIVGGIPGVVLTLNKGFLYPNAGIDNSNAPPGHVVLFPANAEESAARIRKAMARGKKIGVIIGDSRTHPLRLGCVGVALACAGLEAVEDARGQKDLFGRELKITRKAVADNLVSAAQIVMGEGDEGIPAAIVRDSSVPIREVSGEIPTIPPSECMYIGALGLRPPSLYRRIRRSDRGGQKGKGSWPMLLTPDSRLELRSSPRSGKVYSAGNIENASIRRRHLCREGGDGQGHRLRRKRFRGDSNRGKYQRAHSAVRHMPAEPDRVRRGYSGYHGQCQRRCHDGDRGRIFLPRAFTGRCLE